MAAQDWLSASAPLNQHGGRSVHPCLVSRGPHRALVTLCPGLRGLVGVSGMGVSQALLPGGTASAEPYLSSLLCLGLLPAPCGLGSSLGMHVATVPYAFTVSRLA